MGSPATRASAENGRLTVILLHVFSTKNLEVAAATGMMGRPDRRASATIPSKPYGAAALRCPKPISSKHLDAETQEDGESRRSDGAYERYEDVVSVRGRAIGLVEPDFSCMLLHTEPKGSKFSKIEAGEIRPSAGTCKLGATELTGAFTPCRRGTLLKSQETG